jgi:hypothetical protein
LTRHKFGVKTLGCGNPRNIVAAVIIFSKKLHDPTENLKS